MAGNQRATRAGSFNPGMPRRAGPARRRCCPLRAANASTNPCSRPRWNCIAPAWRLNFAKMTPSRRLLSLPTYAWDKSRWWNESSDWREGRLGSGGRGLLEVRLPRATPTWIARLDGRHMSLSEGSQGRESSRISRVGVCGNGAGSGRAVVQRTAIRRRGLSNSQAAHPAGSGFGIASWSCPMIRMSARFRSRASSTKALRGRCMSWAPCAESAPMRALRRRPGSGKRAVRVGAGRGGGLLPTHE